MPRRVAYVAFEPFPSPKGSGTRIGASVRALTDAGYEVHLVTLPARESRAVPEGVSLHPVTVYERNFLARALAFRDVVARRLHAIDPDIVHFRGVFEGQAALAYAQRKGIPAVFEANGLPSVELQYHYPAVGASMPMLARLRDLEAQALGGADMVITQSQTTLGFLRGRGLQPQTPAVVIPNGADIADGPPPQAEDDVVLYTGTLAPWQGVAELLMAARRCNRARPVRFVLAGPVRRRWRVQLERFIRRLKVDDAVTLAGPVERGVLAKQIAAATICVAPLRRDVRNKTQGCSPIKLYEYLAAARPVVATDLPCVREIVDEDRGELIASPRPKLLAERILGLLDDPQRRERLGQAGQAWVQAHATWQHRADALRDAYRRL